MTARLLEYGIEELFILRIKPRLKGSRDGDWLACYRSFSQFGGKPIFWINAGFIKIARRITPGDAYDHLVETLFHEVRACYLRVPPESDGGASLRPLLQKIGLNEEDFCEEFARFMNHRSYPGDTSGEAFESILKAFFALAFGQEEVLAA